ncbi:AP-1 complex-associated regulatory protein, partial [Xenoophorus captivus]
LARERKMKEINEPCFYFAHTEVFVLFCIRSFLPRGHGGLQTAPALKRSRRLPSETNTVTPNTEYSWDFTTKTRSTNDDGTSLDLEWEDEEGINRALPAWERSRTEEDILRAALRPGSKQMTSGPTSASEDSNALEWENDFVSTHPEDNGDAEFEGFVNPVLDTPSEEASDPGLRSDNQDR